MIANFVFLALWCVVAHAATENPLGKVIALIDDLAAKVTADGEAEEKAYKEYVAWCDDAAANLRNEGTNLADNKEKLEAQITQLTGDIDAASSKIDGLAAKVHANGEELAAATKVREKEQTDFAGSEKELVDVIDTLARAISILERNAAKNPAALDQIKATNAASLLQSLTAVADAAAFDALDRKTLLNLAQTRENTDAEDGDMGAPAAAVYKNHGSDIVELLEDLKEKAEGELSDLRKAESNAKHNFSMLKQSIEDEISADNKDKDGTSKKKAEDEGALATAQGDLTKTVARIKTCKESLSTASSTCMTVAADHEATVNARTEELKVIAEAKQILQDTTSGAVEQKYSFLQINMKSSADLANSEVVTLVKNLANKQHSAALAQLASRIQATIKFGSGDDVFKKVKGLIKGMIEKLLAEADADASQKAYCDEEIAKSNAKNDALRQTIGHLSSKIDVAKARSAELKESVKELQGSLSALAKTQAEMNRIRAEEKGAFTKAKADLELGLSGVRHALGLLREYYGSAAAEFVQQPAMPEQHVKSKGAGDSIIGILEVCESDFATSLAKEETQEAEAQTAYDKMTQQNSIETKSQEQDVKYQTQEAAGLDKNVGELSNDRAVTGDEQGAVQEYLGKINEQCVAKPEAYETRKARRAAEIAGLKEALEILSGSSFVQKKVRGSLRGVIQA